jgi:hypothetical protein
MATKTARILSYLPPTFKVGNGASPLYAVVDAFGEQLLQAENSLGAVMLSHWVDHADTGAEFITDLACFGALYGLAPRGAAKDVAKFAFQTCVPVSADEKVEEFREHLKRYVRTFIDGTVTVQGILRIVAEALGLHIADRYTDMDTWWTDGNDPFVTTDARTDDTALILFGTRAASAKGTAASAAQVMGPRLNDPIDLSGGSILRIRLDGTATAAIDLVTLKYKVPLSEVVKAINQRFASPIAQAVNGVLRLASRTSGSMSSLELPDGDHDAASELLGLRPLAASGTGPTAAALRGHTDLVGNLDLSKHRFLRVRVDQQRVAEVDCAGHPPKLKTLAELVPAINRAFGFKLASADKSRLVLTSPTRGAKSSLLIEPAAAQDAAAFLGFQERRAQGSGPQSARLAGIRSLGESVNLSGRSKIRVALDGGAAVTVNCAGKDPLKTQPGEIIRAINTAFAGKHVASLQSHGAIALSSTKSGPPSSIRLIPLAAEDGTEAIFGLMPRNFHGADEAPARITGSPDLEAGADLRSQHLLQISVDGGPPIVSDLWHVSGDLEAVKLPEITRTLNESLGAAVASHDGHHLILTSPTTGPEATVSLLPLEDVRTRRFVTRAYITDEAAPAIFGFLRMKASGTPAEPARLQGETDLSTGVDLRKKRFLRITVDGGKPEDFDFAKAISVPRGATLDEIVTVINARFHAEIASNDGHYLILTSRSIGSNASITISDPAGEDAFGPLFGADPDFIHGSEGTGIILKGTVGLSAGVDLSKVDTIKIGLDGVPPQEIVCAGPAPAHTTLDQIAARINSAVGSMIAAGERGHLLLALPPGAAQRQIEFAVPESRDATAAIFGFEAPRAYLGAPPSSAKVVGAAALEHNLDLSTHRFLTIAADDIPATEVDCAMGSSDPSRVRSQEVVKAINSVLGAPIARLEGNRLVVASRRAGLQSFVQIHRHGAGYAGDVLFGPNINPLAHGMDPAAALIRGKIHLTAPMNLAGRSILRLAVNGARSVDIDIRGAAADRTTLREIIERINAVVPGVASPDSDDHLVLKSPTTGETSSLELLPLRALELMDYPPTPVREPTRKVQHGSRFRVENSGADDTDVAFQLTAPQGESGMQFVDVTGRTRIRVIDVLRAGDTLSLATEDGSVQAEISGLDGAIRRVPASAILTGSLGGEAFVPFDGEWPLTGGMGADYPPLLQLNDPGAAAIVELRAREDILRGERILIKVNQSLLQSSTAAAFDVTLRREAADPARQVIEKYAGVLIGRGPSSDSLTIRIATKPSELVHAEERDKADALKLVIGTSEFIYTNCHASRFDSAKFPNEPERGSGDFFNAEDARFSGGTCREWALFDISRFSDAPPENEAAYFGPPFPMADPAVNLQVNWTRFQPGAFTVNLPADLDEQFGARFDQGRFGLPKGAAEQYEGVLTEPASDPNYLAKQVNAHSTLVTAAPFPKSTPPAGWDALTMPFIHPRSRNLTGGTNTEFARMYLAEDGVPGLIELRARVKGEWGNTIAVTSKRSGTVRFDMSIGYEGVRLESAREIALAGRIFGPGDNPLSQLTAQILKPSSVGILQAKAAGVLASLTRDRTDIPPGNELLSIGK